MAEWMEKEDNSLSLWVHSSNITYTEYGSSYELEADRKTALTNHI